MTQTPTPDHGDQEWIDLLRERSSKARKSLLKAVKDACPGPHKPVQHRDFRPKWCPNCRRTVDGIPIERSRTVSEG